MIINDKMRMKVECGNCCPRRYFIKQVWINMNHDCPICNKPLNLVVDESGEEYDVEFVSIHELEKGDYILMGEYAHQIVNIENLNSGNGRKSISMYNYGSRQFGSKDGVWRFIQRVQEM